MSLHGISQLNSNASILLTKIYTPHRPAWAYKSWSSLTTGLEEVQHKLRAIAEVVVVVVGGVEAGRLAKLHHTCFLANRHLSQSGLSHSGML